MYDMPVINENSVDFHHRVEPQIIRSNFEFEAAWLGGI